MTAKNTDDSRSPEACEAHTGPIGGTAIISGETFQRKAVTYAEVDGMAIFEGDIVLGTLEEVRAAAMAQVSDPASGAALPGRLGIGLTGAQFRWKLGRIAYEIAAGFPDPQRIHDAIAHWEANTRIRFVLRTAANASQHPDYVRFVAGNDCSSAIGRRGGMQTITLGSGCSTGNAIHEIGHTVGLWHEQSREDRGSFIQILWANIDPQHQHNFNQHITDGDDLGNYDYGSIMHYPPTAFSINGQPTIVPLQPVPAGVVIGQRSGLSPGDIAAVHAMYPFFTTLKEVHKDPILDVSRKEILKDPILEGSRKEILKDPIADATLKEVSKDVILDPGTLKEAGNDPGGTLVEHVGGLPGGGIPFVMAGQGRAAGDVPAADLTAQLQVLGEALASAQEQLSQIAAAYDATVQALTHLMGGNTP